MYSCGRHPACAFVLALIPGLGHLYWGKLARGLFYAGAALLAAACFVLFTLAEGFEPGVFLITAAFVGVLWCVSMLDMILTLASDRHAACACASGAHDASAAGRVRSTAMLLSLIPGAGHLYLGDFRRGLMLLIAGAAALFGAPALAIVTHHGIMMLGWLAVPALIAYAALDASAAAAKAGVQGFLPPDGLAERENSRAILACSLSLIPGAGHLYLGHAAQGVRLLALGFVLIFLSAEYRWSLAPYAFLMLLGLSFFDALNLSSGAAAHGLTASAPGASHRWFGIVLVCVGVFLALDQLVLAHLPDLAYRLGWQRWLEPAFISLLLAAFGLDMLRGERTD